MEHPQLICQFDSLQGKQVSLPIRISLDIGLVLSTSMYNVGRSILRTGEARLTTLLALGAYNHVKSVASKLQRGALRAVDPSRGDFWLDMTHCKVLGCGVYEIVDQQ